MLRYIIFALTSLAIVVLAIAFPIRVMCSNSTYWLTVQPGGWLGGVCGKSLLDRMNTFVVGKTGTTVVQVEYPDSIVLPYKEIQEWTWPKGLTIEANVSTDTDASHFQPSEEVLNQLNLRYFVQRDQAWTDSMWRHEGIVPPVGKPYDQPSFWFHHDVRPEWAGKYLCFRVYYKNPDLGNLVSDVTCFSVSVPCSKADSDDVNLGNVVAAGWERDYDRVMILIDSLYNTGWVSRKALGFAGTWATLQHRYDDRLHYLDLEFQHYGNIGAAYGEELTPITPESRAEYEHFRQKALQAKAAYEGKQR